MKLENMLIGEIMIELQEKIKIASNDSLVECLSMCHGNVFEIYNRLGVDINKVVKFDRLALTADIKQEILKRMEK